MRPARENFPRPEERREEPDAMLPRHLSPLDPECVLVDADGKRGVTIEIREVSGRGFTAAILATPVAQPPRPQRPVTEIMS